MVRESTVLPEPDSPTMPRVSLLLEVEGDAAHRREGSRRRVEGRRQVPHDEELRRRSQLHLADVEVRCAVGRR